MYYYEYVSLASIEPEFLPDLENLLSLFFPNIASFKIHENRFKNENTYYYLFFSSHANKPVGFMRINHPRLKEKPKKFWQKLGLNFSQKSENDLEFFIAPPIVGDAASYYFLPPFEKEGVLEIKKLVNKLVTANHQELQINLLTTHLHFWDQLKQSSTKLSIGQKKFQLLPFVIKATNYHDYFNQLPLENQSDLKNLWKKNFINNSYELKNYLNLASFYKDQNLPKSQLTLIKNHEMMTQISLLDPLLEIVIDQTHQEIKLIIFYVSGKNHSLFFFAVDFFQHQPLDHQAICEKALMFAYEQKNNQYLIYLPPIISEFQSHWISFAEEQTPYFKPFQMESSIVLINYSPLA